MFSFDTFLVEALRAGLTVGEFWALTPRETLVAMEAAVWRGKQTQVRELSLAWHIAALTRNKRMPGLRKLLAPLLPASKAKKQPIEKRREEFDELKSRMTWAKH